MSERTTNCQGFKGIKSPVVSADFDGGDVTLDDGGLSSAVIAWHVGLTQRAVQPRLNRVDSGDLAVLGGNSRDPGRRYLREASEHTRLMVDVDRG